MHRAEPEVSLHAHFENAHLARELWLEKAAAHPQGLGFRVAHSICHPVALYYRPSLTQ
jgi:hypothetical protein